MSSNNVKEFLRERTIFVPSAREEVLVRWDELDLECVCVCICVLPSSVSPPSIRVTGAVSHPGPDVFAVSRQPIPIGCCSADDSSRADAISFGTIQWMFDVCNIAIL